MFISKIFLNWDYFLFISKHHWASILVKYIIYSITQKFGNYFYYPQCTLWHQSCPLVALKSNVCQAFLSCDCVFFFFHMTRFYNEAFNFQIFTMKGFSVRVETETYRIPNWLSYISSRFLISGPYCYWQLIWTWLCVPNTIIIEVILFKI